MKNVTVALSRVKTVQEQNAENTRVLYWHLVLDEVEKHLLLGFSSSSRYLVESLHSGPMWFGMNEIERQ